MAHDRPPLTIHELITASQTFERLERRSAAYWGALNRVDQSWPNMHEVSSGLHHLLRSWLRFQSKIDRPVLAAYLAENSHSFQSFRDRTIFSLNETRDGDQIRQLFIGLLKAQKSSAGESPVGVAKSLHLLAPSFFPLWDNLIAYHYDCVLSQGGYVRFMALTQTVLERLVKDHVTKNNCSDETAIEEIVAECSFRGQKKSLLKILDEYNYSRYTNDWIS